MYVRMTKKEMSEMVRKQKAAECSIKKMEVHIIIHAHVEINQSRNYDSCNYACRHIHMSYGIFSHFIQISF